MPSRFYELLICPECGESKGRLRRESNFLLCTSCEASYPTVEGFVDFLPDTVTSNRSRVQKMMEFKPMVRIYEKFWRPAATLFLGGTPWEIKQVTEFMAPPDGGIVLDICSGPGNFSRPFARAVGKKGLVVGLDMSRPMLVEAVAQARAEEFENLFFVHADAMRMPFVRSAFDGVNCTGAIHLFPDSHALCRSVCDLLKPGGCFVGTTYLPAKWPFRIWLRVVQSVITGLRLFEGGELENVLKESGFDAVETETKRMSIAWRATKKRKY